MTGGAHEQGYDAARHVVIPRTLVFVLHGDQVLLLRRAAHKKAFPNRYNALGGHIERNEDPLTSARRETIEESGLTLHNARLCGVSQVSLPTGEAIMLFIYVGMAHQRTIIDSPEGTLEWIARADLEQLGARMVEDIPAYLARALHTYESDAAPFSAQVTYDQEDHMRLTFADASPAPKTPYSTLNQTMDGQRNE